MFTKLKALFQPATVYKIVEIEKPRNPGMLTKDLEEAARALQGNVGFLWLLENLRYEKAVLKSHLENNHHKDLRDVDFVQQGIFWCGWLERKLNKTVNVLPQQPPADATADELAVFEQARRQLTLVE